MGKRRKRVINFRIADDWLLDVLDKIVETKLDSGIRTSFSYELIRLAKNGFASGMAGIELDKKILGRK